MADFSKLDATFQMTTPVDLKGKKELSLGKTPVEVGNTQFKLLADMLENDGRGVMTVEQIKETLESIMTKGSKVTRDDMNLFFDFYSTRGFLSFADPSIKMYYSGKKDGVKSVQDIREVFGKTFKLSADQDVMMLLSRSPFFHPARRNTHRIEVFLNSMPSTILSQMVPYLDVEFQFTRDPKPQVQTMGQLKFLKGATEKGTLDGADKAMLEGTQVTKDGKELDYAGMEMFTSPQTLVNPLPNIDVGTGGARYSDILDPFRPFASLEGATISVAPNVGIMTYRKANLSIKLHDRSRMAEISDLIRPQSYSNTTVWLTYGWRAPNDPTNPYFEYVNNNMLVREAYGIVNSNFSFDAVGQVTINLELFTQGLSQLRTMKITETIGDAQKTIDDIRKLIDTISTYRKRLKLDPVEGINKEIRVFEILDKTQAGEFPDYKTAEITAGITTLQTALAKAMHDKDASKHPDAEAVKGLLKGLEDFKKNVPKGGLKASIQTMATSTMKVKFDEVFEGPDPFLPDEVKLKGAVNKVDDPLIAEIKKFKSEPKKQNVKALNKSIVSFGKLFATFALQAIVSANTVEEVQVFFYALNEQCGKVSGHSLAEFPIDMRMFLDQYSELVVNTPEHLITLEQFLQLIINGQVLDNRAIGYGFRSFYDPTGKVKNAKDEAKLNTEMRVNFKKPAIEMYVEVAHQKSVTEGESDIMLQLAYSAKDAKVVPDKDRQRNKLRRIMRIHLYDKQVNPYRDARQLLKSDDKLSFEEAPVTVFAQQFVSPVKKGAKKVGNNDVVNIPMDIIMGGATATFTTARQVKDLVSKMVPSITFGANGTTVISAALTSKAEPLLSAVNMMRSNAAKNVVGPNGAGERGIPLRVIPAVLSMTTLGCPLANAAQIFFIDFQTGTSLDNLYICTALTHTLAPGKFETAWTFGYSDAYGVFEGAPDVPKMLESMSADISKPKK